MAAPVRLTASILCVAALAAVPTSFAVAPGDLDTAFSGDGKVITNLVRSEESLSDLAIQPDGKIVAVGWAGLNPSRIGLTRHRPDGTLDPTFSRNGKVLTRIGFANAQGLTLLPDGRIVVVGESGGDFLVVRYRPNGTLDRTFSRDGIVRTALTRGLDTAFAVVATPSGKLLVAGSVGGSGGRFGMVRYFPRGRLDSSFSGDGKVLTNFGPGDDSANAVLLQPDGKILVGGGAAPGSLAVARYTWNGVLDATFDGDGKVLTGFGPSPGFVLGGRIALQPDGKIVQVGSAGDFLVLARLSSDGSPDASFGGDGTVEADLGDGALGEDVAVQADGRIVAVGSTGLDFVVARFNGTDGSPDTSFSGDGLQFTAFGAFAMATSVALQADGRIVVGGPIDDFRRRALARYLAD